MRQCVYDWCNENNRADILDRWDYEKNEFAPQDINVCSHTKVWLLCENKKHESSMYVIDSLKKHNSLLQCKICNSFYGWCESNKRDDLLLRWDYELNLRSPKDVGRTSIDSIFFKCPKGVHKSAAYKPCNITKYSYSTVQCPECNSFAQWGIDQYGDDFLEEYWDNQLNKGLSAWDLPHRAGNISKIWIKCQRNLEHGSYKTFPNHFVDGARCPKCVRDRDESYLQEKIRLYLEDTYSQYILLHEFDCSIKCKNNRTGHYMPYDNELIIGEDKHLIVECNGKQHYDITQYIRLQAKRSNISNESALENQKERDAAKKEYVESLPGYYYLAISYQKIMDGSYIRILDEAISRIESIKGMN